MPSKGSGCATGGAFESERVARCADGAAPGETACPRGGVAGRSRVLSEAETARFVEGLLAVVDRQVRLIDRPDLHRGAIAAISCADDARYRELKGIVGPWVAAPHEVMPEARSVIVFFVPFTREAVRGGLDGDGTQDKWVRAHCLIYDNRQQILDGACAYVEAAGFSAEVAEGECSYDEETGKRCTWSHKSAGFISGLGAFGANRTLITEKGAAGAMFTILTDAVLQPSPPYSGPECGYPESGNCRRCFDSCPVGALTPEGLDLVRCQDMVFAHLDVSDDDDYPDIARECLWGNCYRVCPYAAIE